MSREIKFKAWNIQQKKFIDFYSIVFEKDGPQICTKKTYESSWPADENILCQYTGFKDEDDKEIYEMDVLAAHDMYGPYKGTVVWWNDRWAITFLGQDGQTPQFQSLMTVKNAFVEGSHYETSGS